MVVFNESISEMMTFNGTCLNDTSLYNTTESIPIPPCSIFKDPSYYALPYRVIGTIFQGFILIVGKHLFVKFNEKIILVSSIIKTTVLDKSKLKKDF